MNIVLKIAVSCLLATILIVSIHGYDPLMNALGRRPADAVFWVRAADGWVVLAAACVLLFPIILWAKGKDTFSTLAIGATLLAVSVSLSVPISRGAQGLTTDLIVVRPGLPWRSDVRFAISPANLQSRGCEDHGRLRQAYDISYTVLAPAQSREAVIDLGEGVDKSNVKAWLAAMRSQPFVVMGQRASIGSLLSDPSVTRACIQSIGRDLTGEEQNALSTLLAGR